MMEVDLALYTELSSMRRTWYVNLGVAVKISIGIHGKAFQRAKRTQRRFQIVQKCFEAKYD